MKKLLITALLLIPCAASAQAVIQAAVAKLQPQIGRDANGYTTCGIRVIALDMQTDVVDAYDFSIHVRAGMMMGTLKAGKVQSPTAAFEAGRPPIAALLPGPINFWIARESEGQALTPTTTLPAETPGYMLAVADFTRTWSTLLAIAAGERMQFATRYANQGYDTVVSFSATMSADESRPLTACFDGLLKRMKKEAGAE